MQFIYTEFDLVVWLLYIEGILPQTLEPLHDRRPF